MTAQEVFERCNAVFRQACDVADLVLDPSIPADRRVDLLRWHDELREQHVALGALHAKLISNETEH